MSDQPPRRFAPRTPPGPPAAGSGQESPAGPDRVAKRETVAMYDALAYVLAGPLTFGAIGWAIDALAGTAVFLPLGILGGMALSLYYVWFRYGTQ